MSDDVAVLEMDRGAVEDAYWAFLLKKGRRPASVFAFADKVGIEEGAFYAFYAGFDALESAYWKRMVVETIAVLNEDEDYAGYAAQQKLLAFFYTFFSHVQGNRSRLVEYFPKPGLCGMKVLQPMRNVFLDFAKSVVQAGLADGTLADRKKLTDYYDRAMWEHFRMVIEFYRNDSSEGFQDTDAFIEKTVKLAIDGASAGVLDSAIDLARFMLRKLPISKR